MKILKNKIFLFTMICLIGIFSLAGFEQKAIKAEKEIEIKSNLITSQIRHIIIKTQKYSSEKREERVKKIEVACMNMYYIKYYCTNHFQLIINKNSIIKQLDDVLKQVQEINASYKEL